MTPIGATAGHAARMCRSAQTVKEDTLACPVNSGQVLPISAARVDWLSYPILDITEAPAAVDIVLINRPELPPAGASESSTRSVAGAIANAIFDATGMRRRRAH